MDARALCNALGITRRRLDALIAEGLPAERQGSKGRPWEFRLASVARWLYQRSERAPGGERLDPAQERAALDRVRREAAELALQERRGELVPASDQDRLTINMLSATRARILATPSKTAQALAAETKPAKCHRIVESALHEALQELADAGAESLERLREADEGDDLSGFDGDD